MEGDPHPGAVKGRMSFQRFNPSIDASIKVHGRVQKLYAEASKSRQPVCPATSSGIESGGVPIRENGSAVDEAECSYTHKPKPKENGDNKRKQSHVASESQHPNKLPRSDQGDKQASTSKKKGGFKKPKGENLDWNLLRRSRS